MSDIDWSKAPEGATHWSESAAMFYKVIGDGDAFYWSTLTGWEPSRDFKNGSADVSLMIPRPSSQWRGPQDGLPPVGMEVAFNEKTYHCNEDAAANNWHDEDVLQVIAHKRGQACDVAIVWNTRTLDADSLIAESFLPIQSERDKAIAWLESEIASCLDVMDEGSMIPTALAEHLFNAGCRKAC